MNLLQKRTYKRLSAVAVAFGGLLVASVATASGGYGGGYSGSYSGSYSGYDDDDDGYSGRDRYHRGHRYQREPRFIDKGDELRAHTEVRGLKRHRDVRVELDAEAEIEIECVRDGYYGNRFRKDLTIYVDGVEWFSRYDIHYGELDVWVETKDLERDFDHYYGYACPDDYHTRIRSVQFANAKLQVSQGGYDVVTWLCTFERDTKNGPVPRSAADCVTLY